MRAWWESIVPWKWFSITIYSFDPPHFQSDIAGLLSFNSLPHPLIISRKRFCILRSIQTCRQTGASAERKDRTRKPDPLLKLYLQLSFSFKHLKTILNRLIYKNTSAVQVLEQQHFFCFQRLNSTWKISQTGIFPKWGLLSALRLLTWAGKCWAVPPPAGTEENWN